MSLQKNKKNIVEEENERKRLKRDIPYGFEVLTIVIQNDITKYQILQDTLNLAIVCKDPCWKYVSKIISREYFFRYEFSDKIKNYIPKNISQVPNFNNFPATANHLSFQNSFNLCVPKTKCIPPYISRLSFGFEFNKPVNSLPPSITHISFGSNFNRIVDNLPSSITHLNFGRDFNNPVNNLPLSLTHLSFGYCFDQPVDNLPQNIIYLSFGNMFNYPVDALPNKVTHLSFGYFFNRNVDKLPSEISDISFGCDFNQPVNSLPSKISSISFGFSFNQPVNHLPLSLSRLSFGYYFNQPIDSLPQSITFLNLGYAFNQSIKSLPDKLYELDFHENSQFNKNIATFPAKLKAIRISKFHLSFPFVKKIPTGVHILFCTR